ncbi:MAG: four helix bundle protein [Campylobacterota bacterium]|nr:four helix bundle protein [Campylobacterota bacterium]
MKQDNIILDKSFSFAVRIVKLYKYLCDKKKEYVLSKQLLRSGTSVGACNPAGTRTNINEAQAGQIKADFIAKMAIASKEARESKYWIDLLIKTDYLNINDEYTQSLLKDIEEIIKLLTSIAKTSQGNK